MVLDALFLSFYFFMGKGEKGSLGRLSIDNKLCSYNETIVIAYSNSPSVKYRVEEEGVGIFGWVDRFFH